MQKLFLTPLLISLIASITLPYQVKAGYWLVIGSYRQGPGGKASVSGITSPSVYAIPMETLRQCEAAGREITEEIYKPVYLLQVEQE